MHVMQFISFLALYVWNGSAEANEDSYFDAYTKEPISMCELRNLSSYWKTSEADTKISIGKALTEKQDLLPIIQKANQHARDNGQVDCDFWQMQFEYEDAEVMGNAWGIDTYEAKMKLAKFAAQQSFSEAKKLIQKHASKQKSIAPTTNRTGEDAFFASKYDWCHAKMIAKAYSLKSVYEAKVWMGDIINTGDLGLLQAKLAFAQARAEANPQNQCSFEETRFTYKDAEKLAGMWSVSTAEAKVALQNKYLYGLEFDLEERLRK